MKILLALLTKLIHKAIAPQFQNTKSSYRHQKYVARMSIDVEAADMFMETCFGLSPAII